VLTLRALRGLALFERKNVTSVVLVAVVSVAVLGLGSTPVAASSQSLALGSGLAGDLSAVSAESATDAWAVGVYAATSGAGETLGLHWNGTRWSRVASPNPGGTSSGDESYLTGVSARSATDAWAVGDYYRSNNFYETLVLHWNGTRWSKVASPNPSVATGGASYLTSVSARSATNAWAVGHYRSPTTTADLTLALHWNGTSWSHVATPNPGGTSSGDESDLTSVSAQSANNAWAVGHYVNPTTQAVETLALHWNGTRWSKVASPNPTTDSSLSGVSADSTRDAWAVGQDYAGRFETLALHWNGTRWSRVASPNPPLAASNSLTSVSARSATDAWAVGDYISAADAVQTLVMHWNGTSWSTVASPNPAGTGYTNDNWLMGVTAASATAAWAVGEYGINNPTSSLLLHWKGTSWSTN
jgi:hypothetical protein